MSSTRTSKTVSFLAAAGMIGVAAALNRACPGQCASCSTCATTLAPMASAVGAVGVSFVGSALARSRGHASSTTLIGRARVSSPDLARESSADKNTPGPV